MAPGLLSQTSGASCARMSRNEPPLFTLLGANSVMSRSPDHSSLCLMSSHDRPSSLRLLPSSVRRPATRAHEHPRALQLVAVEPHLQVALARARPRCRRFRAPTCRRPTASRRPRRSPRESRLRTRRTRAGDPRRASPVAWLPGRATVPSARPRTAARPRARCGSRSATPSPDASGRRRSGWAVRGSRLRITGRLRRLREVSFASVFLEGHPRAPGQAGCQLPAVPSTAYLTRVTLSP